MAIQPAVRCSNTYEERKDFLREIKLSCMEKNSSLGVVEPSLMEIQPSVRRSNTDEARKDFLREIKLSFIEKKLFFRGSRAFLNGNTAFCEAFQHR